MKLLKSFVSFTLPLIVMLLAFSIYLLVNKVVDNYKQNITNDYSIVVITNTPLVKMKSIADIGVKDIVILSREKIIKGLKKNLSDSSLKMLNTKLPYFYRIYLEQFPTTLKLEQIRKELNTISNVKKVETFSTDHNKVYSILMLIQDIVTVLFVVILMLSFLLLSKQVKIWFYEHKERINIVQLHGGSLLYSSKPIFKVILLSSLFSSLVVAFGMFATVQNISMVVRPEILALIPDVMDLKFELIKIVVLAFAIPMITFFSLITAYKLR